MDTSMVSTRLIVGIALIASAIGMGIVSAAWQSCETKVTPGGKSTTCAPAVPAWLSAPFSVFALAGGSFLIGQTFPAPGSRRE